MNDLIPITQADMADNNPDTRGAPSPGELRILPCVGIDKPAPDLLTIDEVADRLRVCRSTIRRFIQDGQIKSLRIGKFFRIPVAELDRFLESCRTSP